MKAHNFICNDHLCNNLHLYNWRNASFNKQYADRWTIWYIKGIHGLYQTNCVSFSYVLSNYILGNIGHLDEMPQMFSLFDCIAIKDA